jgi:hypothetical protein
MSDGATVEGVQPPAQPASEDRIDQRLFGGESPGESGAVDDGEHLGPQPRAHGMGRDCGRLAMPGEFERTAGGKSVWCGEISNALPRRMRRAHPCTPHSRSFLPISQNGQETCTC